jgi:hypothetical protein
VRALDTTGIANYSDEDVRRSVLTAVKVVVAITVVALPLVWWKLGWSSAALLLVGAVISGSGLWEWRKLMTSMMAYMDAGGVARPMASVLIGFFLRLAAAVVGLYVSLKFLDGSVYALAAGLGMGVFALTIEGVRLARAWTA